MERLTKRIFVPTEERDVVVFTQGEYIDTIPAEMTHDDIRKALRKLAEYEDFEEIFREKMTDTACEFLKDKEEFGKWLDRNKWIAKKCDEHARAEEQGLLLKLPCKVGDKIFLDFAGFGKDIDKFTVKDFHLDCFEYGETILFCDYESNDKPLSGQIDVMEFGKTVFLTQAEAEQKLKEMESSHDGE